MPMFPVGIFPPSLSSPKKTDQDQVIEYTAMGYCEVRLCSIQVRMARRQHLKSNLILLHVS